MSWLRYLIFLTSTSFLVQSALPLSAQDTLRGRVYDASNNLPLTGAMVRSYNRNTKTDRDGKFTLPLAKNAVLKAEHSGFHTLQIPFNRLENRDHLRLFLTPTLSTLAPASGVEAIRTPEFEYVFDYAFDGDNLLVLSYMSQKQTGDRTIDPFVRCAITVLRRGEQVQRILLPDYTQNISIDPVGGIWIEAVDTCIQIVAANGKYKQRGAGCDFIYETILPLAAVIDTSVFTQFSFAFIPQVGYYVYFPYTDKAFPVRFIRNANYFDRIADDFAMLTRREHREAINLEEEFSVNRKLFAPFLRRDQFAIDTEMPYSRAFGVGHELLIFDTMNQWLFRHDATGQPIDSTEAYYRWGKEKLDALVQDPVTEKIYAVHDRGGVKIIREVNTATGAAGQPHKINYPFPENIQVYEGYVYYIRHIVKGESNKHLYREKLPRSAYAKLDGR